MHLLGPMIFNARVPELNPGAESREPIKHLSPYMRPLYSVPAPEGHAACRRQLFNITNSSLTY